jgi:tRNA threonylcarbamoyladenosine biosynthesis protein TsaB
VRDGRGVAEAEYVDLQGHAERLVEAIDAALARAGATRAEIGAIACDVGPGSFTGVRVGVASGKGIALARGAPMVGVISLEAMAMAAFGAGEAGDDDLVIAALDAKKSEVFLGAWLASGETVLAPVARPLAEVASSIAELPSRGDRVVVGEVAAGLTLPAGARLARGPALDLPDATWVGTIAAARLASGGGLDPEVVEPLYVRPPDAVPMRQETA